MTNRNMRLSCRPIMAICASVMILSGCSGGLTSAELTWRAPYIYQGGGHRTAYTINVRNDSIILGSPDNTHFLVLDPMTGAILDTLRQLEGPERKNILSDRYKMTFTAKHRGLIVIPVDTSFMLDSLVEVTIWPSLSWRIGWTKQLLAMRRRSDRQWATLEFDTPAFSVHDIVPYNDHCLLLQYGADDEKTGPRAEVGLLDLNRVVRWPQ
jgi:hypothetical protein